MLVRECCSTDKKWAITHAIWLAVGRFLFQYARVLDRQPSGYRLSSSSLDTQLLTVLDRPHFANIRSVRDLA